MDKRSDTARERALLDTLLALEEANETVCALRTDALYDAMIRVPGMSDALSRLDDARRAARSFKQI
jgi:hypothetical protein